MQFAIKITAGDGFNGSTVLDEALLGGPFPRSGPSGVIEINVPASTPAKPVGLVDPDLQSTPAANRSLLLQSFLVQLGAAGGAGDVLEVVDDEGRGAFVLKDLNGVT